MDFLSTIIDSKFLSTVIPSIFVGMLMFYNGVIYQRKVTKKHKRVESYKNILKIFNDFKLAYKVYENGLTDIILEFNLENQKLISEKKEITPESSYNHRLEVEKETLKLNSNFYGKYLEITNSIENEKHYLNKKDLEVVKLFEERIYLIHTYIIKGDVIPYMTIKYIKELYDIIEESTQGFTEYFRKRIN